MKQRNKKEDFYVISMLLGTLGANLLGNLLTRKGIARAGSGRPSSSASQNNKGKGIVRAGYSNHSKNKTDC